MVRDVDGRMVGGAVKMDADAAVRRWVRGG